MATQNTLTDDATGKLLTLTLNHNPNSHVPRFKIGRRSAQPILTIQLQDTVGNPFDLTGFTEAKLVAAKRTSTDTDELVIDLALSLVGLATTGKLRRTWVVSDTTVAAGLYRAQIEVTLNPSTGSVKFPLFEIEILGELRGD